jgi:arylsulfatase A-like enzyme
MQANGYQTAIVGKWHLKTNPQGFDYWNVLPGQGDYYNPDFRTDSGRVSEEGYVTDIITDKALTWLKEKREQDKPFLLMLQNKAPHRAWDPGPEHAGMFEAVTFPEPSNLFDDYSGRGTAAREQKMTIDISMRINIDLKMFDKNSERVSRTYGRMHPEQKRKWDSVYNPIFEAYTEADLSGQDLVRWKYQRYMRDYLSTIKSVDENVGRVLDYLEKSGLDENTIVIYNSDQGFYLGEHGWFDKRFMYEESYRTPLLIRWPGVIGAGQVNDELVSNLDFAQTFLDIAHVAAPEDMQGLSILPILKGKTPENWRTSLYYHYYEFPGAHSVKKHEGVATRKYKLMHFYELDEWELYDLEADPSEMQSMYDDPAYADIVAELKKELEKLKIEYKVPQLMPQNE